MNGVYEVRRYGPGDTHPTTESLVAEARMYAAQLRCQTGEDFARRDQDIIAVELALLDLDDDN